MLMLNKLQDFGSWVTENVSEKRRPEANLRNPPNVEKQQEKRARKKKRKRKEGKDEGKKAVRETKGFIDAKNQDAKDHGWGVIQTFKALPKRYSKAFSLTELDLEEQLFAQISMQTYKMPDERENTILGNGLPFNLVVKDLFNKTNFLFYKQEALKEIVLAFRGTADWDDVLEDFAIGIPESWQVNKLKKMCAEKQKSIEEIYAELFNLINIHFPGYSISLTGHSLGGKHAMDFMMRSFSDPNFKQRIEGGHIFNPAASGKFRSLGLNGTFLGESKEALDWLRKMTVHLIVFDPLSNNWPDDFGRVKAYTPKQVDVHTLKNFIIN